MKQFVLVILIGIVASCGVLPYETTTGSLPQVSTTGGPSENYEQREQHQPQVSPVAEPPLSVAPQPLPSDVPANRRLVGDVAMVEYWLSGGRDLNQFLSLNVVNEGGERVRMGTFLEGASREPLAYEGVYVFPQSSYWELGDGFAPVRKSPDDLNLTCEEVYLILLELGSMCLGTYLNPGPGVVIGLVEYGPTNFSWISGNRAAFLEANSVLSWYLLNCEETRYKAQLEPDGQSVRVWEEPPYAEYALLGISLAGGSVFLVLIAPEAAGLAAGAAIALPVVSPATP